jgi:hypothetical protein
MRRMLLVLMLIPLCDARGQWIDKQGNTLPDAEDRKSVGTFGAEIIFTTDPEALEQRWATPSDTVHVNSVDSVRINQPISAFIVFSGCKPTASRTCNVSMSFRVIQPDGKQYAATPSMEVWRDKPAPTRHGLALSVEYLKIRIEPHEQQGRYVVQVEVRDEISGDVISLKKAFVAKEG